MMNEILNTYNTICYNHIHQEIEQICIEGGNSIFNYSNEVTSIKHSPVLKRHLFHALS
jgi:hypothetical protein